MSIMTIQTTKHTPKCKQLICNLLTKLCNLKPNSPTHHYVGNKLKSRSQMNPSPHTRYTLDKGCVCVCVRARACVCV